MDDTAYVFTGSQSRLDAQHKKAFVDLVNSMRVLYPGANALPELFHSTPRLTQLLDSVTTKKDANLFLAVLHNLVTDKLIGQRQRSASAGVNSMPALLKPLVWKQGQLLHLLLPLLLSLLLPRVNLYASLEPRHMWRKHTSPLPGLTALPTAGVVAT